MSGVWCLGGQFEYGIGGVASTALSVGVWLAVGLLGRVGNGRLPARGRASMRCMASFVWIMHQGIHRFKTFGTVRVMKNESLATPLRLSILPDLINLFLISILLFFYPPSIVINI